MKEIKKGSTGIDVKVAQYLLNTKVTGTFDAELVTATKNFQKNNSLSADGIIGPKTWTKLASKAPTVENNKSNKNATKAVQTLLSFAEKDIDGICGPKTIAKIRSYQSTSGLGADGCCGPKTWAKLLGVSTSTSSSGKKVINNCVHYLQWDSRWKNVKYSTHTSSQTIGNSGCGTTSMAQILATWYDKKITPVETSALAVKNGFRTYNSGTAWGFFKWCFNKYPCFKKYVQTNSVTVIQNAVREGALVICSMGPGDNNFWTSAGHYITVVGTDDTYIYANDPNKSAAPRKQAANKFSKCLKQAFIFYKK